VKISIVCKYYVCFLFFPLIPCGVRGGYVTFIAFSVLFMSSFNALLSSAKVTQVWLSDPPSLDLFRLSSHWSFGLPLLRLSPSFASHTLFNFIMFKLNKCVNYNSVACFRFVQQLGSQQQVISMATRGIGGAQKQVVRIEGSRATVQGNTKVKIQGMAVLMSAVIFGYRMTCRIE